MPADFEDVHVVDAPIELDRPQVVLDAEWARYAIEHDCLTEYVQGALDALHLSGRLVAVISPGMGA